eukprot:366561-Chlamydomonas_euryale.AAC.16
MPTISVAAVIVGRTQPNCNVGQGCTVRPVRPKLGYCTARSQDGDRRMVPEEGSCLPLHVQQTP